MTPAFNASSADRLMAASGKTFYRAARFLPRAVRADVVRLYAFCRRVDDLADEPLSPVAERRRVLEMLALALRTGNLKVLRAIGWPCAAQGRLPAAAALLIDAALHDLDQQQPATEEDLLAYAFGVAGTVGVMMAEVLHANPVGYRAAVALGMAMQLSNIVRDVVEDLHQYRVYLPASLVPAAVVAAAVQHGTEADRVACCRAARTVLAQAESLYETAYDGIWSLPWRMRWSILAAAMCYRRIGIQVGQNVERSWQKRSVVSAWRKASLIAAAGVRLLLPRFWRRPTDPRAVLPVGALVALWQLEGAR